MPSKDYLMLRSAQRACPRLELGARLEARTASLQPTSWSSDNFLTASKAGTQEPAPEIPVGVDGPLRHRIVPGCEVVTT